MNERERLIELICDGTLKTEICTTETHLDCDACRGDCGYCTILADHLLANGVTVGKDTNVPAKWIPASEPPKEYRDKYGDLIPFLVCEEGTKYPFRAMYDGKTWGDWFDSIIVKWWMPFPQPPKEKK